MQGCQTLQRYVEMLEAEPIAWIYILQPGDTACCLEAIRDIIDAGIVMTGRGSLLPGIDKVLSVATGLPVCVAENPLDCVALGAGRAWEDSDYRGVLREA